MTTEPAPPLRAVLLNCTLRRSPADSSTDRMLGLFEDALTQHDVSCRSHRIVDADVRFGVSMDEGDGDGWPALLDEIVAAQLLVVGTPIWLGHPASPCQVVLERLDAMISETDDRGRPAMWDRVAMVGIVGNEDGAHHVAAEVFQALDDCGYTIGPGAAAYWVGEAMGSVDFKDLATVPDNVVSAVDNAVSAAVHLARLLVAQPYPAPD